MICNVGNSLIKYLNTLEQIEGYRYQNFELMAIKSKCNLYAVIVHNGGKLIAVSDFYSSLSHAKTEVKKFLDG